MDNAILNLTQIEKLIYTIRGQRVMLDADLAKMYGVETKVLNQVLKRHSNRFPLDFAFQPTFSELGEPRSQIVTLGLLSAQKHITHSPHLFTENGVAMLSGLLNSDRAIAVNISIMRIFTRLRSFLLMESDNEKRLSNLEKGTNKMFKVVFERLDAVEEIVEPKISPHRKKIGLK
jgi:hypothetical protein